jgi:LuxR family maltose regulon positive regulatory protein
MNAPLCDAVVNTEGSGKLLREIARDNLFVIPLDEQGEWYRYHQLFSDFLFYELQSSHPSLVPVLHHRASVWSEGAGYFERAIRHAIAAEDYGRAGMLIARHWFGYTFAGQTATVERWLESLPEGSVDTDAALVLVKAWISALYGRREDTERFLALAESIPYEGPLPDGTASVESGVAPVRGVFGFGGVRAMAGAIQSAAESESKRISARTVLACLGLGLSLYYSGDSSGARTPFEEGLRLTRVDLPVLRIVMLSGLSLVAGDEGDLEEAESLALEARGLVEKFGLQEVPQSTAASIVLGRALAKRGKLAEAQVELESGISARRKLGGMSPWPALIGFLELAQVHFARGDRGGARQALAEARTLLEPFGDDTGAFAELLERQERKLRSSRQQNGSLNEELSGRELKVLGLICEELSIRQIAERRYVAPSTVRTQIKSVYRKLGVFSRKEAVDEAHDRGLI